ncbi:MAG: Nif3-like dinuclear metal center hexameric protein [Gemmatimonadales bacterium]
MTVTRLDELRSHLDSFLRITEIPDEPNAVNGLQVENASGTVRKVVAAVDATLETIAGVIAEGKSEKGEASSEGNGERGTGSGNSGGTLLLVHHGLFWDGNQPVTGRRYRRLRMLMDHDIALYSAHIPLDVHPEVGNNAVLAEQLEMVGAEPFTTYRGVPFGASGVLRMPREALVSRLEELLGASVTLIPGGPAVTERVGIITGGGGTSVQAAHAAGLDTFITGEGPHHTYHEAMELGVNLIYAGHYATETVGVKALAQTIDDVFGLPWTFHHHPTGL